MSETDEARVSRYEAGADPTPRDEAAQATPGQAWHELLNMTEGVRLRRLGDLLTAAGSVMGLTISREFQADMAAGWKARAETAEAEVERLTRECLDREATETEARERLRRYGAMPVSEIAGLFADDPDYPRSVAQWLQENR